MAAEIQGWHFSSAVAQKTNPAIVIIMNESTTPPFIGREALLAELRQFLNAPATYALSIQSMEGMGRSALLRRITTLDPRFVCVLMPLTPYHVTNLDTWLEALADATRQALQREDLATARLPAPNAGDLPRWLGDVFLPTVGQHVRQQARVIWLFDDIHLMGQAISEGKIPPTHPAYLLELALAFPFLSIITSADEDSPHLNALSPLIQPNHVLRLNPLGRLEVEQLLSARLEYVPPALAERAYLETGGMPRQVNDLVDAIQRGDTPDDALEYVYARSQAALRCRWNRLSRDERVVLTAITNLLHDAPTREITAQAVEVWLAQSDNPMDTTAIAAQLRGLEFRHILRPQRQPLRLQSALMTRWLLENARQELPTVPASSRAALLIALVGLVVVVLLVAFLVASLPPAGVVTDAPLPTLPLGGTN